MGDLYAQVVNGQIVNQTSTKSSTDTAKTSNDSLDKEAFLQLLVAEMQYQDPLEPTTNTEYISQFATFSQLEATQNVELSNKVAMANDLVGKNVIMKVTSEETGKTTYESGMVDYVFLENQKVYLSIGGNLYNVDYLDTVVDGSYLDAVNLAQAMEKAIKNLPEAADVTLADEESITEVRSAYNNMTAYQQNYISKDSFNKLSEVVTALDKLKKAQE